MNEIEETTLFDLCEGDAIWTDFNVWAIVYTDRSPVAQEHPSLFYVFDGRIYGLGFRDQPVLCKRKQVDPIIAAAFAEECERKRLVGVRNLLDWIKNGGLDGLENFDKSEAWE